MLQSLETICCKRKFQEPTWHLRRSQNTISPDKASPREEPSLCLQCHRAVCPIPSSGIALTGQARFSAGRVQWHTHSHFSVYWASSSIDRMPWKEVSTAVLFLYFPPGNIQRLKSQSCPQIPPFCFHPPSPVGAPPPGLLSLQPQGSQPLALLGPFYCDAHLG